MKIHETKFSNNDRDSFLALINTKIAYAKP